MVSLINLQKELGPLTVVIIAGYDKYDLQRKSA